MEKLKIYLAGPINGCTEQESKGWRNELKRLCAAEQEIEFLDPTEKDCSGLTGKEIVEFDKDLIEQCDLVFANCQRFSLGTSMEVIFAWERKKPVVCLASPGISIWLDYHVECFVESLKAGAQLLQGWVLATRLKGWAPLAGAEKSSQEAKNKFKREFSPKTVVVGVGRHSCWLGDCD